MAQQTEPRICAADGCGTTIGRRGKTGLCRRHALAVMQQDAAFLERQRAGLTRFLAIPGAKEASLARMNAGRRHWREQMTDDEHARERRHGRWLYETHASRPDVRARAQAPEVRIGSAAACSETVMRWCPRAMRSAYRVLRAKRVPAAEARRMIEAEIALHARREVGRYEQAMLDRRARDQRDAY